MTDVGEDLGSRRRAVTLDDVYADAALGERALLSGLQAIVRLILGQQRLDRAGGLDTGAFVSGYEGSPLGGLDLELGKARAHLDELGIVFAPGLNEELAATAVAGTQRLADVPVHRHDGVVGYWYGKNPGLDRAADAIRHANYAGTSPLGGAVALIGDDPAAKSSTLPSSAGPMARSLHLPLLAPGTIGEVISLGHHAVAMSRASGLWAGLQIVTDVADGSAVVDLGAASIGIPAPDRARVVTSHSLLGQGAVEAERDLFGVRLPRAVDYAVNERLNDVTFGPRHASIGVLAPGYTYRIVVRALEDMGLGAEDLERIGLRLVRVSMPWPLTASEVRRWTAGLDEVVVIEDKEPFIESQVKEALYGQARQPIVSGKSGADGRPLVPAWGTIDSDTVAGVIVERIGADRLPERTLQRLAALTGRERLTLAAPPPRAAAFCSGCPHNVSTRAGADELVGLGIGCHVMAAFDEHRRGHHVGLTQMGGEGAQWTGLAPFSGGQHFVQNIGDGTFFHSGSLAVRAAVAAGVDITYKILYNDAVAMTGGQRPVGRLAVVDLVRLLAVEGVSRVIVTTPEPGAYRGVDLGPIAEVRHRDGLQAAMAELREVSGVTVLLHDDGCAAEERRLRHRGRLAEPDTRVWINPAVCEGCGDCGEKSSCLSVVPIDTELGRKTAIHQGSCNHDRTCLEGDCPSFVLVKPSRSAGNGRRRTGVRVPDLPVPLSQPAVRRVVGGAGETLVRMPGIGGTGVVTASRILQMAAHLDGLYAAGLDQTGMAQKGGAVVSDVRIASRPINGAVRAGAGSADLLLGFDILGAAGDASLATADRRRTVAVVNTAVVPTSAMVIDPASLVRTERSRIDRARIDRATKAADNLYLDAEWIAERLFADHLPANLVLLGAAYQHGCLPVSAEALEEAIRLNGTAAEVNEAALSWGRAAAIDPDAVIAALSPPVEPPPEPPRSLDGRLRLVPPVLRPMVALRAADLAAYQSTAYAGRYLEDVLVVARAETARTGDDAWPVTSAYAASLHKLMAYKDEYEVARLHLDRRQQGAIVTEFGEVASVEYLLAPPILATIGLKRKIRLGRVAVPTFRVLSAARRLRGTAFDPFGRTEMRRSERALVEEYRRLIDWALDRLEPTTAGTVTALAAAAEEIRGYEDVKRRSIARYRSRVAELSGTLDECTDRGASTGPSAREAIRSTAAPAPEPARWWRTDASPADR